MRLLLLLLLLSTFASAQEVIITGIIDGDQSGSPRAVELYINGTVDLTGYSLGRYANGAPAENDATALSGSYTDEFVYVINNQHDAAFTSTFGTAGDFSNRIPGTNLFGTGDDVFVVRQGATIIDQVGGDIGDGSNIYQDSWLYRNDNTGPDGTWIAANWMNIGNNFSLDGFSFAQMGAAVPFGTYSTQPPGPTVSVSGVQDGTEDGQSAQFTFTAAPPSANTIEVVYTYGGTATEGADFTDAAYDNGTMRGSIFFSGASTTLTLPIIDDTDAEGVENIEITLVSVSDATYMVSTNSGVVNIIDNEAQPTTFISQVQGSGTASPLVGQEVTIEGIVVGDFQNTSGTGLEGFFVQEEDADQDGNPATSEGIFVFDTGTPGVDVNVGDLVSVSGTVAEFTGGTQVNASSGTVTVLSSNNTLPTAATLDFPVTNDSEFERIEGMRTTIVDPMTITETFGLGRFGEITVSEGDRLIQFTECNQPNASALAAYNAAQADRTLVIDDGRSGDNNFPISVLDGFTVDANNSLRSGAVLTGLTGILDERFTGYRLQPTATPTISNNDRPFSPPAVGGVIKVASMNVLNYFNGNGQGGGFPTSRGADNLNEFQRQEAKIVAAICALDADIIGLIEIENDGFGPNSALQGLVNAISAECGVTYDFVEPPATGSDEIQVALIYNTATVTESGTAAALTSIAGGNRVPVAQTFRVIQPGSSNFGQSVTVCVNHFKSKGSGCGNGDDANDGSGNCNGTRTQAAQAVANWLNNDDPTGTGEEDILIVGDLNAYRMETPIQTLLNAGFTNTVVDQQPANAFPCGGNPSYVFRGEWGSLDYALASSALSVKVTGANSWNVNSPEPTALDYDTEFNDPALYQDDAFRFSDHDPILVGLNLGMALPVELVSLTGRVEGKQVVLNWATATEVNSDRFEVQRRTENGEFTVVGTVSASGNSSSRADYAFVDTNPANGSNDYRLRTVDLDGSSELSNIISVAFSGSQKATVTRAGVRSYRLTNAPVGTKYLLTDVDGRAVRTGTVAAATTLIDGTALPAGIYFLVVNDEVDGTVFKVVME